MSNEKILIVEDEKDIAELLVYHLEKDGYKRVVAVSSGEDALREAKSNTPDLIFLDLMLPGIGGLDVCRKLKSRGETSDIPIIMLTAKSEESDVVVGLELGADDYITKPFSPKLVVARMRAILRRYQQLATTQTKPDIVAAGPIRIDLTSRDVFLDGEQIHLTRGEFEILLLFVESPNRVFTRNQLMQDTRGGDDYVTERAIDVQILGLRRKLGDYARLVETIRGIGYSFRT
ncbi:MAG: response regulator [Thermoguttaceae bacterium]